MSVELDTAQVPDLGRLGDVLAHWQSDRGAIHLHPGDLGWFSMRGPDATARAIRTWSLNGDLLAVGLLDGPGLLRLAFAPGAVDNQALAEQVCSDVADPARGVLPGGEAVVEARGALALQRQLLVTGWDLDEPWTPLHRDLSAPLLDPPALATGLQVEEIKGDRAGNWMEVHWSAFRGTPFGADERREVVDWWTTMMDGPFAPRGRSLALVEPSGVMVAVVGIWSAGPGRPGLVEPVGVHRDHRGKGYGAAMCQAAAKALQCIGSSSAVVCAESANAAAVATYTAAGFSPHPPVRDLIRVP